VNVALEPRHETRHKAHTDHVGIFEMAETFEDFVARERDRLNGERDKLFSQQQEIENALAAINREMAAITAYEHAKTGKPIPQARARKATPTGRRGSKRDSLLALLRDNPAGFTRGELLDQMGLKGDKSGEMSVSNALTGLVKSGAVVRVDGRYKLWADS
jgi:hypothetical protein